LIGGAELDAFLIPKLAPVTHVQANFGIGTVVEMRLPFAGQRGRKVTLGRGL
jgi:hypothetical protein